MLNLFDQFDPAQSLTRIVHIADKAIVSETPSLDHALLFEAAAQSCGLHLRWSKDFRINAYLVSCANLSVPAGKLFPSQRITARLLGTTSGAASYAVHIEPLNLHWSMVIGFTPTSFQEHFARRVQCLRFSTT